ncbi:MAG: hypothetical protein C0467_17585 [Planctomycetaceae bacterium]|nr:hypothetical protein [Planctomycetaceae bacterium]
MRNDKPNLIEVIRRTGQAGAVISTGGGLDSAHGDGADAAEQLLTSAVRKAIAPAVKRAGELFTAIQAATRTEQECGRRAGEVERARKVATAGLFGAKLDTRLRELDAEERAIVEQRATAQLASERAVEELQKLRGEACREPVSAVGNATAGRLRAAEAERARAADVLAAAVAQQIGAVLKLDGELAALREVNPRREVEQALAEQLPAVFGAGGIASLVPDQDEDEYEPLAGPKVNAALARRRRGTDYVTTDRTEAGTELDGYEGDDYQPPPPRRLPPDEVERY